MKGGWYCSGCGALYSSPGYGYIVCQKCGHSGLRGFSKRPVRVRCEVEGCEFTGWDDGGVNDDLGMHRRREHA
jgi:DNA-directed RNA polymerase subunit RPC12/RpoP